MLKNVLKAQLKICEYSRNNQKSYDDAEINSNKDFNLLVYFIFAVLSFTMWKKHTWTMTHDVSSLLVNVGENCCSISAQKTTKLIFFTICSQSENTDSDLKVHALHYANDYWYASDLPFKVVLWPKTTKKIIVFFFGFQNYVN